VVGKWKEFWNYGINCLRGSVSSARPSRQVGHYRSQGRSVVIQYSSTSWACSLAQPGHKLFSKVIWRGTPWCSAATECKKVPELVKEDGIWLLRENNDQGMRYNAVVCSAGLSSEVYHQTEHTLSNIFFLLHGSRKNML